MAVQAKFSAHMSPQLKMVRIRVKVLRIEVANSLSSSRIFMMV